MLDVRFGSITGQSQNGTSPVKPNDESRKKDNYQNSIFVKKSSSLSPQGTTQDDATGSQFIRSMRNLFSGNTDNQSNTISTNPRNKIKYSI